MKKNQIIILILSLMWTGLQGQKKFEIPEVYYEWNKLSDAGISRNGDFISYEINKLKGDGYLHIQGFSGDFHDSVPRGDNAKFSPSGNFIAYSIEPQYDSIRELKLEGVKKKKFPADSLGIYFTSDQKIKKYPRVKSFKLPDKENNWIAWLHEKPKPSKNSDKDTASSADSLATDTADKQTKGQKLIIYHPETDFKLSYERVTDYQFSKNGELLIFAQRIKHKKKQDTSLFRIFNTQTKNARKLFERPGKIKEISCNRSGSQYAFIFTGDTTEIKKYSLYLGSDDELEKIADSTAKFLKTDWQVSAHSKLDFSRNGKRLLFETDPVPEPEPDDTLTDEEKYKVDIWHWKDKKLQPQQKKEKKKELKRNYLAFYQINKKEFTQVENKKIEYASIRRNNNSRHASGYVYEPYKRQTSWTGRNYRDIYYMDLKKEETKLLLKKYGNRASFSPQGRYMLYYSITDSCWWSYDIHKDKKVNLTKDLEITFLDPEHDTPNKPYAYSLAGWDKEQNAYVYDKYDIWKLDAEGDNDPVNLTDHKGRKENLRFRYIKTDPEQEFIPEKMFLSVFNFKTKASGFARCNSENQNTPEILIQDDYMFYNVSKAKESEKFIFRKGNFRKYPNLWSSGKDFNNPVKLSTTNPQQSQYQWGSVELTNWTSSDGDSLSGLIYKPDNFNPDKKYPMIVYFYEEYSNHKNAHYIPKPSHSVINFTRYVNDDYIVFIPDIVYEEGYPGQSAERAVLSGTLHMINQGYIDKEKIGMQGQSWGGYQVAHLATRTDLFSAAMSGAPVSNMTSAYGGIRWGSGKSRAFQYEKTQSRIGKSLWKRPLHYIENSPLFFAPQITTPLLIMHNDEDGAVPYSQGIEFFNALRRLDKTAYMLVYNNDSHNLRDWGNRIDLSIRMKQFFDHYLKDKPMPVWMKEGIPATEKGKKTGYKLTD